MSGAVGLREGVGRSGRSCSVAPRAPVVGHATCTSSQPSLKSSRVAVVNRIVL